VDCPDRLRGRLRGGRMTYVSTRTAAAPTSLSGALRAGLATDGGLYIPTRLPDLSHLEADSNLASLAASALAPFAEGDALEDELPSICRDAFNFPAPVVPLSGARSPAACSSSFTDRHALSRISARASRRTCLARLCGFPAAAHRARGTSGDTGGVCGLSSAALVTSSCSIRRISCRHAGADRAGAQRADVRRHRDVR
jgi:threonine synthase